MFYVIILIILSLISTFAFGNIVRLKSAAIGNKWPQNIIPYVISEAYIKSDRELIEKTLRSLESNIAINEKKCIQFVPRKNHQSYIRFQDADDCSSAVGYFSGLNVLKLSKKKCIRKGLILHELMHGIGFDHEHSRYDRDAYINVYLKNVDSKVASNFDINPVSNNITNQYSPYDYNSIMQYNSNAISNKHLLITSKFPSLLQTEKIDFHKEELSPIDIIQVQRLYKCQEALLPNIKEITEKEFGEISNSNAIIVNEAVLLKLDVNLTKKYYMKSLKTCGSEHYWPLDYPIIPYQHELYKTVCLKKKGNNVPCKLTIECENGTECLKIFFRDGLCRKPNSNPIKTFARIVESKTKQFYKSFKKVFDNQLLAIKRLIGK